MRFLYSFSEPGAAPVHCKQCSVRAVSNVLELADGPEGRRRYLRMLGGGMRTLEACLEILQFPSLLALLLCFKCMGECAV